jgi:ATP-dependent exoDNAse (exonuclease V) beta subunit
VRAVRGASLADVKQPGLFDAPAPPAPRPDPSRSVPDVPIVDLRVRSAGDVPGGPRYGDLVHALLAAAPFDADRVAIDDLAVVHGRIVVATEEEVAAAAGTVARVLSHAIIQRARAADARGACRRETPVTCTVGRGEIVEGVVDLAFEEQGQWTVVDYKTDREIAAAGEERYKRQVAFYSRAIAEATGQPARAVLVRV